ncbi:CAMK family protein kinase [Tritrichomonas foetus]|uniref:CAMK family protein kinase n=1 Tax=Tritrichomonas foetus TaxID=1144522 RepID=A0A1J4JBY6_9EUKA|nr:CAMK family protein kinase [Tritrichomonas foetus]|eukprot:OHS94925.1 CAMK family protein kinase [Tritrichomonas foetus]
MEYCSNGSVADAIRNAKNQKLPLNKVRKYMTDLVQAVRYLHSKIIIHRDLKPGNMLIDANDNVKLCDFGLATFSSSLKLEENSICGTLNYISPEIYRRTGVTLAADIYSLGCVLYTMIVGVAPFTSQSRELTLKKARSGSFDIPAGCDPRACDLIRQLMNKNVDQRPTYDQILKHNFFNDTSQIEPKKCPFNGGVVDLQADGTIILDVFSHPTLFRILPRNRKVEVVAKSSGRSHQYDISHIPKKYIDRYEFALRIIREAEKSRPLVIWNSEEGKFVLFKDFSFGLIYANQVTMVPEGYHDEIRASMHAIVDVVNQSGKPRWPVIVGKPI